MSKKLKMGYYFIIIVIFFKSELRKYFLIWGNLDQEIKYLIWLWRILYNEWIYDCFSSLSKFSTEQAHKNEKTGTIVNQGTFFGVGWGVDGVPSSDCSKERQRNKSWYINKILLYTFASHIFIMLKHQYLWTKSISVLGNLHA